MKTYKAVLTLEFQDGHEEFVIWEPELLGSLLYNDVDIFGMFYDPKTKYFTKQLLFVKIELYESPQVKDVQVRIGDNEVTRQILIGTKILPIRTY